MTAADEPLEFIPSFLKRLKPSLIFLSPALISLFLISKNSFNLEIHILCILILGAKEDFVKIPVNK